MENILITGSTGFLGGAVVAKLIESEQYRLFLLVRSSCAEEGLSRIKHNLLKFNVTEALLNKLSHENIIVGDLVSADKFCSDPRLDGIHYVINCAAIASFGKNPSIWKVNVEGTYSFAERMSKVEGLKRFIHVGTAMSCAPEANSTVLENFRETDRAEHLVDYTWSKITVEKMLLERLPTLPVVIARPSIVVGHTKFGCEPSSSIFWVFRMALTLGKFMCRLEDRIDVVPVDYCADALTLLLHADRVEREIIHISAGEKSSVSFYDIDQAMSKATGEDPVEINYKRVSYQQLAKERKGFPALFGPCNEKIMLRAMNLYGNFSKLNVVFNNDKLLRLGMHEPGKFTDYLYHCVNTTKHKSIAELMAVDFK